MTYSDSLSLQDMMIPLLAKVVNSFVMAIFCHLIPLCFPNTYKRESQLCVMNKRPPTVSLGIVLSALAHCVYCPLSW